MPEVLRGRREADGRRAEQQEATRPDEGGYRLHEPGSRRRRQVLDDLDQRTGIVWLRRGINPGYVLAVEGSPGEHGRGKGDGPFRDVVSLHPCAGAHRGDLRNKSSVAASDIDEVVEGPVPQFGEDHLESAGVLDPPCPDEVLAEPVPEHRDMVVGKAVFVFLDGSGILPFIHG